MLPLSHKPRIFRHLRLSALQEGELEVLMGKLNSPMLIEEIESLLEELDSIEAQIKEELTNPNYALIQADVLKWEGGGARATGMKQHRSELRFRLANLLGFVGWTEKTRTSLTKSLSINYWG